MHSTYRAPRIAATHCLLYPVTCFGTEGRNNGVNERPFYPGTLAEVAFKGWCLRAH